MKIRKKQFILKNQFKHFDLLLLIIVIALSIFGLLMIYDASSVSALNDFGDKMYFLKEQSKWFVIGLVALFLSSTIPYKYWYRFAVPLLITTLILLLMVFIPGIGVKAYGARRWINLGFFVLQPAELSKLSLIVYLSAWLSSREKGRFFAFIALIAMVVGLVILEPDLGTALIIGIVGLMIYFISGAPIFHLLLLIPFSLIAVLVTAVTSSYRFKRLLTFFDPTSDPLGASYHISQVLLALGSGGLFGLGLGKSIQKYAYLPEATTDSIFAIIGEEIGFTGSVFLILVFLFLIFRCYKIGKAAPDKFGYLLAMGITFWISVQTLINLSAMTVVLPLTGVPLPFISYGGSGLVVTLFSIGILLNISKNRLIRK